MGHFRMETGTSVRLAQVIAGRCGEVKATFSLQHCDHVWAASGTELSWEWQAPFHLLFRSGYMVFLMLSRHYAPQRVCVCLVINMTFKHTLWETYFIGLGNPIKAFSTYSVGFFFLFKSFSSMKSSMFAARYIESAQMSELNNKWSRSPGAFQRVGRWYLSSFNMWNILWTFKCYQETWVILGPQIFKSSLFFLSFFF